MASSIACAFGAALGEEASPAFAEEPGLAAVPRDVPHADAQVSSIRALDLELGRRRSAALRLQASRDDGARRLVPLKKEQERLAREIALVEEGVREKDAAVAKLLAEMKPLLLARAELQQWARAEAQRLAHHGVGAADGAGPGVLDARRHQRTPLAVEVTLEDETNFFKGFSEDVSEGGVFVSTYATRPVGDLFPLVFSLPGHAGTIRCLVEVAWVREYAEGQDTGRGAPPGMGLRFLGLDAEDQAAIVRFQQYREPLFFPEADDLA